MKNKAGKLYIIKLKSQPNPDYPMWAEPGEITSLLKEFEIIE